MKDGMKTMSRQDTIRSFFVWRKANSLRPPLEGRHRTWIESALPSNVISLALEVRAGVHRPVY
jgi:hypothetical protein